MLLFYPAALDSNGGVIVHAEFFVGVLVSFHVMAKV